MKERLLHSPKFLLAGVLSLFGSSSLAADCRLHFDGVNKHRSDFLRYEMNVAADVIAPDGSVAKHMTSSSQFDMADGLRMKTSGLNTQSDFVIIHDKGWNLTNGSWTPMPAEQLKLALEGVAADRYVYDKDTADFECPGKQEFEAKSHESFVFKQTVGTLETRVVAYFDGASGLPAATIANAEVSGYKVVITTRYRFDPSVRVEPPD